MITFYTTSGEKVTSNNKLIENVIALKTANARSRKRIENTLNRMDLDGLTEKLLQDTEKMLRAIK